MGGQGLNTCWRDVNNIFDILNENSFVNNHNLKYLKSKYYLSRLKDIFFTIVITDSLISFFANRNYLLIPIRKISFILLNKFVFIRKIILNQMTKSIIFKLIK